jgi:hypothetical protein
LSTTLLTRLPQSALFSAVVAALLAVSVLELQPDPQDKPTHYLKDIYHLLANHNTTHVHTHPFSPPESALWVNSLWTLSLVITLSCSLLAILVQQWARRYIKLTLPRSSTSPHQQARTRAFFDKGIEKLHLQSAVDAMPILLHVALVLFLVGLVIFSLGPNHTVFIVVVSWVGLCTIVYACFTLLPIIRHDSTYYTPLSSPLWFLYTGALSIAFRILGRLTAFNCCNSVAYDRFNVLKDEYEKRFFHGIERVAEEYAQQSSPEVDNRILLWTLQSSRQDCELEQFLELVPNFYGSRLFGNLSSVFETSTRETIADALIGLMARTLSSGLLCQSTKQRRIMICNRAMTEASLPISRRTLGHILYNDWSGLLDSVEFGLLLTKARYSDPFSEYYSQCVVSVIIARVRQRDDRWSELATGQLRIPRSTLEYYLAHGDSILLANCIFISRRTFEAYTKNHGWPCNVYSESGSKTLELISQVSIQQTLPELQDEFCDLWNKLVRCAGSRRSWNISVYTLNPIHKIHCSLHHVSIDAPAAFSTTSVHHSDLLYPQLYPLCTVERNRPTMKPSPGDGPSALQVTSEVQDGVFGPATPRGDKATPWSNDAASSHPFTQTSPHLPGGRAAPHNSVSLALPAHFQFNHPSSSLPTPPIDVLSSPAASTSHTSREMDHTCASSSSYPPPQLDRTGYGTICSHKDVWTPSSALPLKELQRLHQLESAPDEICVQS